jgi:heme/copper-type cytochrome/quinol oxidase subunit 2
MMDLIYQPYFILLLVSLIITVFYYFINKNNNENQEEKENVKKTNYINLIIVFLVAYLLLLMIYYGYKYFENSIPKLEKLSGGASGKPKITQEAKEIFKERITIYGDDVDVSILEN